MASLQQSPGENRSHPPTVNDGNEEMTCTGAKRVAIKGVKGRVSFVEDGFEIFFRRSLFAIETIIRFLKEFRVSH